MKTRKTTKAKTNGATKTGAVDVAKARERFVKLAGVIDAVEELSRDAGTPHNGFEAAASALHGELYEVALTYARAELAASARMG